MSHYDDLVNRYISVWNEVDDQRRAALVHETWSEHGTYADPLMNGAGRAGIAKMIGQFHAQMPGLRFERHGNIDTTSDTVRFAWHLIDNQGRQIAAGTDFAELSPTANVRFERVVGFLDTAPSIAAADSPTWGVGQYAKFWAKPDLSLPTNELADDVEGYWPGCSVPLKGVSEYIAPLRALLRRVPDFTLEVADHANRGNTVFIRWIARGTDDGIPFQFDGVDCVRQKDGQVIENRIFCDHPLIRSLIAMNRAME